MQLFFLQYRGKTVNGDADCLPSHDGIQPFTCDNHDRGFPIRCRHHTRSSDAFEQIICSVEYLVVAMYDVVEVFLCCKDAVNRAELGAGSIQPCEACGWCPPRPAPRL